MAPVKKKRVSKKNKKSWRKHVDIQDVDNFLEDQRLEERLGVKYSEQKNEELFVIDTKAGTDNVVECLISPPKLGQNVNSVSMRLRETEIPKCYEALVKRSAVPPQMINKTKLRKETNSRIARKILKRKLKNSSLKAKRKEAVWEKTRATAKNQEKPKVGVFNYDVWAKENNEWDLNGCSDWLSNDTIRHTLHNTGKLIKQVPISKTSLLPAIERPHPGLSYNPSLKDHTALLEKVAEAEIKVINEENHLNRVTTKLFDKVPQKIVEKQWLSEMTVGLSMGKSKSDEEDEAGDYKAVNPPVKNKKKTLKKRRKLKEAMLLKEKLKQQKIEKRKISDIYKLRKINEILNKKEEATMKNIEKRKKIKERKLFTTKVLSQVKYQEPEIDFHMAEELSGNLRSMTPEGNLLYDRFKSLQKRNILQPTLKRHVKKRKMKEYERANTKMGWEPLGFEPFEEKKVLGK